MDTAWVARRGRKNVHGMKRVRENGEQGAGELGRRRGENGYGMDKGYGE